jgi:hypothetical protein
MALKYIGAIVDIRTIYSPQPTMKKRLRIRVLECPVKSCMHGYVEGVSQYTETSAYGPLIKRSSVVKPGYKHLT